MDLLLSILHFGRGGKIVNKTEDIKTKVQTLAYSGAAAGVVGGFTIHSAIGFTIGVSADIRKGVSDLPPLGNVKDVESLWRHIKCVVLDEVYFIDAAFLNVIHQRLCEITKVNKPFGGLFVIFSGDPTQKNPSPAFLSTITISNSHNQLIPTTYRRETGKAFE